MNTTATWYRGGTQQSGGYVGCVGYDGSPVVGRFAFTTGAGGAAQISFRSAAISPAGSSTWSGGGSDAFRFAVTTGASDKINAVGGGTAVSVEWGETNHLKGTLSVSLLPNTTYYLWIWPASSSYNLWKINSVTATLSGYYGNPATPSAADGYFGESIGISLTGGSAGASYTVTVACAGRSETLQTQGNASFVNWSPSVEVFAPLLPNAASATATVTVVTYYGGASVGTRTGSLTVRFREADVGPGAATGWYSHAAYNTGAAASFSAYIQGVSRAEISFDATKLSTQYGATITAFAVRCGGSSVSTSPYRTPVLNGESEITVTATDSRGFSVSESFTVTPLGYAAPTLTGVSVFRCDAQGDAAEDGTYLSITATAVYSSLNSANSAAITYALRQAGGSYGSESALTSGQTLLVSGVNADRNYELRLRITDGVGSSGEATRQIPGQKWAMKFRPSGEGAGFGMAAEADKRLQIPADWEIVRGDALNGTALYVPLTESGSSGIWQWRKWADGSFELLGGVSDTVDVDSSWGALYYATLLSGESFPFAVTAIDFAAAWIADAYCWAMGNLGGSLTATGNIYAISPVVRTNTTLALRILIRGKYA